jgi:hypothetical protein
LIREYVEFLYRLTLNIGFSRRAENVDKPAATDGSRDILRGQRDAREQPGEFSASMRMPSLLLAQNELLGREK